MILKRLKLFASTVQLGNGMMLTFPDNYVPDPGSGYTFPLADELANKQTGLVPSNSNTGLVKASGGSGQPPALTGPTNNRGQLALPDYTNKQNGSNTASTAANVNNANGANPGSVMQKQSYDKPSVLTNNVNSNTAQTLYKEQLDNVNKTHQQELKSAITQSSKRGEQAGMKKAGVWQGLKNTWRNAGTMKKIGMGGAALAGTYFLGKGLLGGNNNNDQ